MAPSISQIKSLLESYLQDRTNQFGQKKTGGVIQFGNLIDSLHDEFEFHIAGEGHSLATRSQGLHAAKAAENSGPPLSSIIDPDKPIRSEVDPVAGGGDSQWAAAVLKTNATTKTGESSSFCSPGQLSGVPRLIINE